VRGLHVEDFRLELEEDAEGDKDNNGGMADDDEVEDALECRGGEALGKVTAEPPHGKFVQLDAFEPQGLKELGVVRLEEPRELINLGVDPGGTLEKVLLQEVLTPEKSFKDPKGIPFILTVLQEHVRQGFQGRELLSPKSLLGEPSVLPRGHQGELDQLLWVQPLLPRHPIGEQELCCPADVGILLPVLIRHELPGFPADRQAA